MIFKKARLEDIVEIDKYCGLRPCNICEAKPSTLYMYYNVAPYEIHYYADGRGCIINCYDTVGKTPDASALLPYCKEEDLPSYFKLQEKYFNEELHRPLIIYPADERGLQLLKSAGLLDNYEIKEEEGIRDYLYEGESLRTLAGRKLSKKRNLIHQFEKEFEGRWEYRRLALSDYDEVAALDEKWMQIRYEHDRVEDSQKYNNTFEDVDTLHNEKKGIDELLNYAPYYDIVRAGGIFIDGALEAFSVGAYDEINKMAIIDVEKANPEIRGLFQLINREFLAREFPEAEIINREDDVGIENIRRAKLSYYPSGYARKYILKQKMDR